MKVYIVTLTGFTPYHSSHTKVMSAHTSKDVANKKAKEYELLPNKSDVIGYNGEEYYTEVTETELD